MKIRIVISANDTVLQIYEKDLKNDKNKIKAFWQFINEFQKNINKWSYSTFFSKF